MEVCDINDRSYDLYRHVWYFGIGAAFIASIGVTFGSILQKMAHNENNKLSREYKKPVKYGMLFSKRWFAGLFILATIPTIFDAIALTLAPQSLVTPMGGATIILNQLLSPPILGESLSKEDWKATLLMFFGIVVSTVSGPHIQADINSNNIVAHLKEPGFIAAEIICSVSVFFALSSICYQHIGNQPSPAFTAIAFAWLAAIFGSQQNISFKAIGMLIYSSYHGKSDILTLEFLILIVGAITVGRGCIGLARFDAVLFVPMYTGFLIICGVTLGGVFYKEFICLKDTEAVLFPIGILVLAIGIMALAKREKRSFDYEREPMLPEKKGIVE